MFFNKSILLLFGSILFLNGCEATIRSHVTSDPSGAHIYGGPPNSELSSWGEVTPYTQSYTGIDPHWLPWCIQVRKNGYHDSEVICRKEEYGDRLISFVLKPKEATIRIHITSKPAGAHIYGGPPNSELSSWGKVTPYNSSHTDIKPASKSWCYQARKEGYRDSLVICREKKAGNRHVHFNLIAKNPEIKKETAGKEEIVGKVVKVNGRTVKISIPADSPLPSIGDKVVIGFEVPGVGEVPLGNWKVSRIDKGFVFAAPAEDITANPEIGYKAKIKITPK